MKWVLQADNAQRPEEADFAVQRVSSKVQEVEDALNEQLEQAKKDLKCAESPQARCKALLNQNV